MEPISGALRYYSALEPSRNASRRYSGLTWKDLDDADPVLSFEVRPIDALPVGRYDDISLLQYIVASDVSGIWIPIGSRRDAAELGDSSVHCVKI